MAAYAGATLTAEQPGYAWNSALSNSARSASSTRSGACSAAETSAPHASVGIGSGSCDIASAGRSVGDWWVVLGSNQWPLLCESSALPLSERPGTGSDSFLFHEFRQ